jgi:hypothetical protein
MSSVSSSTISQGQRRKRNKVTQKPVSDSVLEDHFDIYAIKLTGNNYYIEKTKNLRESIENHFYGENEGLSFLQNNKPLSIHRIFLNCISDDETKYVIQYMEKYGIDKVRGAAFLEEVLTEEEKEIARRLIGIRKGICFNCDQTGHYTFECPFPKNINYSFGNTSFSSEKRKTLSKDTSVSQVSCIIVVLLFS